MKEILGSIHGKLSQDAGLLALVGSAGKVRRARQPAEVDPPCVIISAVSEKRLVEGTDRLRDAEVSVSAYASADRSSSDIAEAIVAALDDADLSDQSLHSYACIWTRGAGEPSFEEDSQAYKRELAFRVIYRLK